MKVLCILLCVAFTSGFYLDSNGTHENKIVGGSHVKIEDVPYQASVLPWKGIDNICGATIIHASWILTAAHCVEFETRVSIRIGTEHRIKRFGHVHNSAKIIIHGHYNQYTENNDIALIKLTEPIKFNSKQQPIELAKPYDIPREGEVMRISGFGKTGEHGGYSDILMAAYVHVVNQENCVNAYRGEGTITDNMFCAGNGTVDTCEGDSGGPAVINGKLYGITSTGTYCDSKVIPGVYTRVHKFHKWIADKTGLKF